MTDREKHISFRRNYCTHHAPRGVKEDACKLKCGASERTKQARDTGEPNMSPCIGGHNARDVLAICPKWERVPLAEAEKYADDVEEMTRDMESIVEAVRRFKTWTSFNQVGKTGSVKCPKCGGVLRMSQAAMNGHVWAKCETLECLNWRE